MTRRPARILFYVQHLLGIGHLARASRIAQALVEGGMSVTMVTGGAPVAGFPGPGIDRVELPPVRSSDEGFSELCDLWGRPVDEAFKESRRALLLSTFERLRPEAVVIEAFPFGRRQMRFELLPLLAAIDARVPKPLLATSVRDILQERSKPGRDQETVDLLNRHFDLVMVHGDPRFASLADTFALAGAIRPRIAYTGLVAAPTPPPASDGFAVLISAGGGAAGGRLVEAGVAAARQASGDEPWLLLTGPNLPQAAFEAARRAAPPRLSVQRFRADFAGLLGGAKLSVSQAGYNTVCDVLRAGCRCLLVPFAAGGETEQGARAERLQRLGLARLLTEAALSGETLGAAIGQALAAPPPPKAGLDLDGAAGTARLLRSLLP